MNKLMKRKLNKKGFTLIELIVVIAIVAVLAVVGIPAIAGQVTKAQQASLDSNAKIVATQAQLMVTQLEVEGAVTKPTDADIIKAAGVDTNKVGTITITWNNAAPWSCDKVVVAVKGTGTQTGTWTRV